MTVTGSDEEAFAELFERHRHAVHAFLLARTSEAEAARDLLQETFLRLWRRLDEVRRLDEDRQKAWVFTVARNLTIDRYRSQATREATVAALAGQPDTRERFEAGPDLQVALREQLGLLARMIAQLPEEEREILTMTAVAGMSSTEVGEALGLPAGTVRYRLHRARARLAAALDPEG